MKDKQPTFSEDEFKDKQTKIYYGELHPWAINKQHHHMSKVIYEPVHFNPDYEDARRGHVKTISTWVFSEDGNKAEHISKTKFNLLIDFTVEPNATVGLHTHADKEEIYYIIDGDITMTTVHTNGQEHTETLRAGDAHFVKLGQGHYGTAGPEGARIMSVCVTK